MISKHDTSSVRAGDGELRAIPTQLSVWFHEIQGHEERSLKTAELELFRSHFLGRTVLLSICLGSLWFQGWNLQYLGEF